VAPSNRLLRLADRIALASAAVVAMMRRWSGARRATALVYHRVEQVSGDPAHELVPAVAAEDFATQVGHLVRHYRVVPASQLREAMLTRRRGEALPVAITFDDDLVCHRTVAMPVLRAAGAPATFFLCGRSLNAPHRFWWERLQAAADRGLLSSDALPGVPAATVASASVHEIALSVERMDPSRRDALSAALATLLGPDPPDAGMRAADVEALARAGSEIGFHTRDHHPLPTLDDASLTAAVSDGRGDLEALAGHPLKTIAYPHGAFDERTARVVRAAGYATGFTTSDEALGPVTDPTLIGRLEASAPSLGLFALRVALAPMRIDGRPMRWRRRLVRLVRRARRR
jgi:peptidoglycan/xylan/chitin deacetylase (PgdA/CDA1 family)